MIRTSGLYALLGVLMACTPAASQPTRALNLDFAKVTGKGAVVASLAGGSYAVKTTPPHRQDPAGVEMSAAGGKWDLSKYRFVVAQVRNLGSRPERIHFRVENEDAANSVTDAREIDPRWGWTWTKVALRRPAASVKIELFGMTEYPWGRPYTKRRPVTAHGDWEAAWLSLYPSALPYDKEPAGLDPARIARLWIGVADPDADCAFEVRNVRPAGAAPSAEMLADPAKFFPCIDEFGQYVHAEWPGKTHEAADLAKSLEAEKKELEARPGPEDWDQYGGWKHGPTLKGTGFFRTEKHAGKWWLVDPEGRLFFSTGLARVGPYGDAHWGGSERDETPTKDRETWFKGLTGLRSQFRECTAASGAVNCSGYYSIFGPLGSVPGLDFGWANNKRKYYSEPSGLAARASYLQRDWKEECGWMAHERLRSWGLNSIGSFSSRAVCAQKKTPYVRHFLMHHWAWTVHAVDPKLGWNDPMSGLFFDPFAAKANEFRDFIAYQCREEFGPHLNDPWCIGFMIDAEFKGGSPIFLGNDDVALALGALGRRLDPALPNCSKAVLLADLKAKYGTIEKLNAAWGAKYASWETMANRPEVPDVAKAHTDLAAFNLKLLEAYFRHTRDAIKSVAPNQLYLGCISRFASPSAAKAAAKYCDVVSYRLNWPTPASFRLPEGCDVPVLAAEFGFSALDRGMLAGDLPDQAARAEAYKAYMTAALVHPQFVGCHWLKYRDYPATGRAMDEANYNVGFVDIADTPYPEMVQAAREIGKSMYKTRMEAK